MVMPHIGAPELIIILVVIFVIFGVGKLPQVGSAIGKGMRAFRQGKLGLEEEEETPKPKKRATKRAAKSVTKE